MGLPKDWARIQDWLDFVGAVNGKEDSLEVGRKKNPELPVLVDYNEDPGKFSHHLRCQFL